MSALLVIEGLLKKRSQNKKRMQLPARRHSPTMPTRLLVAHGEGELIFFVARHPRTSDPMMLGRRADSAILEVHRHVPPKAAKASWLVAGLEQVVQDGALYLATPIDPLLLLLPLLERARGGASSLKRESSAGLYKPLSEAFGGDEAGLEQHLTRLSGLSERLRAICDVNDKYGEPMVRLSDPLVLGWLRRKAEAVAAHLRAHAAEQQAAGATAGAAGRAMTQFDCEGDEAGAPAAAAHDAALATACHLVGEYLPDGWAARLCASLDVPEAAEAAAAEETAPPPAVSGRPRPPRLPRRPRSHTSPPPGPALLSALRPVG